MKTIKNGFLSIKSQYKFINARSNSIKNVGDLVDDEDAVSKKHLNEITNAQICHPVLLLNPVDWIKFFEMGLNLFHTADPKVFILRRTIKIRQDAGLKLTGSATFPFKIGQLLRYYYLYGILMIMRPMI